MRAGRRESGNALGEFVVLLPLYLVVIVGTIYVGDMGMARIRLQTAGRYLAWHGGEGGGDAAGLFFSDQRGSFGGSASQEDRTWGPGDLTMATARTGGMAAMTDPFVTRAASEVLSGRPGPGPFHGRTQAELRFGFLSPSSGTGDGVMFLPDVDMTSHAVAVRRTWNARDRGNFNPSGRGSGKHAVEDDLFRGFPERAAGLGGGGGGVTPRYFERNEAWDWRYKEKTQIFYPGMP